MLLSEFIERTDVTPTAEEYARIESEYYEYPGDKDAFCRAWKRANPASVRKAKEAKAYRDKLTKVFAVMRRLDCWRGTHGAIITPAKDVLKTAELNYLKDTGFDLTNYWYDRWYTVMDLMCDLSKFYNNSSERV